MLRYMALVARRAHASTTVHFRVNQLAGMTANGCVVQLAVVASCAGSPNLWVLTTVTAANFPIRFY
jgi:hypothetical protein